MPDCAALLRGRSGRARKLSGLLSLYRATGHELVEGRSAESKGTVRVAHKGDVVLVAILQKGLLRDADVLGGFTGGQNILDARRDSRGGLHAATACFSDSNASLYGVRRPFSSSATASNEGRSFTTSVDDVCG